MESKGIKYTNFVEVTHQSIKTPDKLGKLPTVLITKMADTLVTPEFTTITSAQQAQEFYGQGSVYHFARNYFNFINRGGDSPDVLHIYTWAHQKAQNPAIIGTNTPTLEELKKINGKFDLTMDTTTKTITLNLTGKNSHTEIATELTNAIKQNNNAVNGFKDAEVKWSSVYNAFILTAGTGVKSIGYPRSPSDGTDVSNLLGLHEDAGARIITPYNKVDTLQQALDLLAERNDNYFIFTLDFEVTKFPDDLVPVGSWVHDQQGNYLVYYSSTQAKLTTQYNATEPLKKYNGLSIEYTPNLAKTNGKTCGIMSSIDYSKIDGNINIGYSSVPEFIETSIKDDRVYDYITNIHKNRSNTYVTARNITEGYTWFQPGNVMGPETTSINIYTGNFVIKSILEKELVTWLTYNKFPSTVDVGSLELYVISIMTSIRTINLITLLDVLRPEESIQIQNNFQNLAQVESNLKTDGFSVEIAGYDKQKKCVNIKLIYVINTPIRKICIQLLPFGGE